MSSLNWNDVTLYSNISVEGSIGLLQEIPIYIKILVIRLEACVKRKSTYREVRKNYILSRCKCFLENTVTVKTSHIRSKPLTETQT